MHYITQNSKFCEYNKDILFAGSWTYRKHGSRNEDTIGLFDECLKNDLQLDIIDRNSKINTMNVYPNKYSENLYHSVDYKELIHNINNKYEYILNLKKFKILIQNDDSDQLKSEMKKTNYIKNILKGLN